MKRKFEVGMFFMPSILIISCSSSNSAAGPAIDVAFFPLVPGTTSLYARPFEKGLVLVNPGSHMQQFTLPDTLGRYAFSGGGRLVDGQKPDMTLELAEKVGGEIAIQPGRAMILSGD
jgi:hypothetical protein